MPAHLRRFDPAAWRDGGRSRWSAERLAWCQEVGVDYLEVLRRQVEELQAAARLDEWE